MFQNFSHADYELLKLHGCRQLVLSYQQHVRWISGLDDKQRPETITDKLAKLAAQDETVILKSLLQSLHEMTQ